MITVFRMTLQVNMQKVSLLSGPVILKMIREFPGAVLSISHDRKYLNEVCGKEYELTADGLCIALCVVDNENHIIYNHYNLG